MDYLLAVVVGFCSGATWEYLGLKQHGRFDSIVPSRFVEVLGRRVHLHHWLYYILVLVPFLFWVFRTGRQSHPFTVFVLAAILGAFLYGLVNYSDWLKFF